jgi:hypothetical protein
MRRIVMPVSRVVTLDSSLSEPRIVRMGEKESAAER